LTVAWSRRCEWVKEAEGDTGPSGALGAERCIVAGQKRPTGPKGVEVSRLVGSRRRRQAR
ncbi:hypothetical protein, partial [Clostridioides difficile]|uniref:hypothetical protein n=1 Tax=Clostridioides difficile TaxID=1496 RepID=UPI001A9A4617